MFPLKKCKFIVTIQTDTIDIVILLLYVIVTLYMYALYITLYSMSSYIMSDNKSHDH